MQKIVFYVNQDKQREVRLAKCMQTGLRQHGLLLDIVHAQEGYRYADLVCLIGIKSMDLLDRHVAAGQRVLYFDKGYKRTRKAWRIAFDGLNATDQLDIGRRSSERADMFGWSFNGWRNIGSSIMIAGSSAKFQNAKSLADPTAYAEWLRDEIRMRTSRKIWYRPKPSWGDAVAISGTDWSKHKRIEEVLDDLYCLITYGSGACLDALFAGIPSIVLGDGITKTVSSTDLDDIGNLKCPSSKVIQDFINRLAWFQWTFDEISHGDLWEFAKCKLKS